MTEFEKTADECDTAAQLQDHFNQQGRAVVSAALASEIVKLEKSTGEKFDGCCVGCGEDLPAVRIAYGRVRCTPCQTTVEKLDKQRAR